MLRHWGSQKKAEQVLRQWMEENNITMKELVRRSRIDHWRGNHAEYFPPGGDPFVSANAMLLDAQKAEEAMFHASTYALKSSYVTGNAPEGIVGIGFESTQNLHFTGVNLGVLGGNRVDPYEVKMLWRFNPLMIFEGEGFFGYTPID